MKKGLLLICSLIVALSTYSAIPQLTKSTPLTLTAASEGFSQSANAKALVDGEWINWPDGTIHEGYAKWRVNVVNTGVFSVSLDMKSLNTYEYRICVLNPATNDTLAKCYSEHADRHTEVGDEAPKTKIPYENTALPTLTKLDMFAFAAGEYDIIVTNIVKWSQGQVRGITLTHEQGDVTTVPGTLIPDNARLSPRAWIDKSSGVDSILFTPRGSEGHNLDEWVKWAVEIPETGYYNFTANTYRSSSQKFEIALLSQNEADTLIINDNGGNSIGSGNASISTGQKYLTKGIYVLRVRNIYQYAESRLLNAVVTYNGGKAVNVPGTLDINHIVLSDEAWVDKSGTVDSIFFTAHGSEGHNSANWAKWKVNVATAGAYNFKANVYRAGGSQKYEIKVLSNDENTEHISNSLTDIPAGLSSINSGGVYLEEGIYTIKVRNTYDYAKGALLGVQAEYVGGAVQNMPGTTDIDEAWFSSKGTRADNKITIPAGYQHEGWVKWIVSFESAAKYKVKVNISNTNGHNYTVALYRNENDNEPITVTEGGQKSTIGTLDLGLMSIPAGSYILKVTNAIQYSDAELLSVQFVYAGGATINVPATLQPVDAILSERAWVDTEGVVDSLLFTPRGSEGYNDQEWAKWKIRVSERGLYNFTANVYRPSGSQKYEIKVLSADESSDLISYSDQAMGTGAQTISTGNVELTAGNYIVKIRNIYNNAESRLLNIAAERATFIIDEAETNVATVIGANNNLAINAQLTRSLTAGMYNTICLPFAVSAAEKERVFGAAKIIGLESSSIEEGDFVLNLHFDEVDAMVAGTPYLIKPTAAVANPTFLGVTIDETLRNVVTSRADFIGNFVAGNIPVGEENLFLGADDLLYFSPNQDMPILGMRAYFAIHDAPAGAIRRARIIAQNNVVTEIDLVQPDSAGNNPVKAVSKRIEDGKLIIIIDGREYNVMGVRLK